MLQHFYNAKLSIFNNKWSDIFDFKVYSSDPNAKNQIKISENVDNDFVTNFDKVNELMDKAGKIKGEMLTSIK